MIEIQDGSSSLAKLASGPVARVGKELTIGQLERELLSRFPKADAEDWDRTGLLVGDPAAAVRGVAVALDPTSDAIEAARRADANVLLTHHPAFIEPPAAFSPSHAVASAPGVNVYKAIEAGVALMNFHTALDVSREGQRVLPGMLGLDVRHPLVPSGADPEKGYGILCEPRAADKPFKLSHLSARCTSVFGRAPRVWGDASLALDTVVTANGSAGNVVEAALAARADCLVCGEIRYHAALDALQAGLAIVELGHDVSELPLAAVLAQAAIDAGVPRAAVSVIDQSRNWFTPESTRI